MRLDTEQIAVVECAQPCVVSGGAGTGKTTALVARALWIAKQAAGRHLILVRHDVGKARVLQAIGLLGGSAGLPDGTEIDVLTIVELCRSLDCEPADRPGAQSALAVRFAEQSYVAIHVDDAYEVTEQWLRILARRITELAGFTLCELPTSAAPTGKIGVDRRVEYLRLQTQHRQSRALQATVEQLSGRTSPEIGSSTSLRPALSLVYSEADQFGNAITSVVMRHRDLDSDCTIAVVCQSRQQVVHTAKLLDEASVPVVHQGRGGIRMGAIGVPEAVELLEPTQLDGVEYDVMVLSGVETRSVVQLGASRSRSGLAVITSSETLADWLKSHCEVVALSPTPAKLAESPLTLPVSQAVSNLLVFERPACDCESNVRLSAYELEQGAGDKHALQHLAIWLFDAGHTDAAARWMMLSDSASIDSGMARLVHACRERPEWFQSRWWIEQDPWNLHEAALATWVKHDDGSVTSLTDWLTSGSAGGAEQMPLALARSFWDLGEWSAAEYWLKMAVKRLPGKAYWLHGRRALQAGSENDALGFFDMAYAHGELCGAFSAGTLRYQSRAYETGLQLIVTAATGRHEQAYWWLRVNAPDHAPRLDEAELRPCDCLD